MKKKISLTFNSFFKKQWMSFSIHINPNLHRVYWMKNVCYYYMKKINKIYEIMHRICIIRIIFGWGNGNNV
jgi:hypothetical protein